MSKENYEQKPEAGEIAFGLASTPAVTTVLRVEGMTCAHCERAVTSEVSRVPGVLHVVVDIEEGTVTVEAAEPVDRAELAAAIEEAGYSLVA